MMLTIARWIMRLATSSLRQGRADWAAAMQVEFKEVSRERALAFALGCLAAAWRDLFLRGEGRLRLTSYAVAIGLIVPIATFNLGCSFDGFRFMAVGHDHYYTMLAAGSIADRELAVAYKSSVPVFTAALVLLGLLHVWIAWALLGHHWRRIAVLWPAAGLVASMLLGFALWLFPSGISVAPLVFADLVVELVSVPALAIWDRHLSTAARNGRNTG